MITNDEHRILLARTLASLGHNSQKDKVGEPYFGHVERVALSGESASEKVVGYLHDIVEDGHITQEYLESLQLFSNAELEAIKCLNKGCGLDEFSEELKDSVYLSRVKANELARRVKIADIRDNMDVGRFHRAGKTMTEKDFTRIDKYKKSYEFLLKKGDE